MVSKKIWTVGSDPEFFLRKEGKLVSAIPFINGTKREPLMLKGGVGLSFDNVALEFSTPISRSARQFAHTIKECFRTILKTIPDCLTLDTSPAAVFPEEELRSDESKQFGCDPDYNAWTLTMNKPPDRSGFDKLRSCGGHVHVGHVQGYDFLLDPFGKVATVQAMDIMLGVTSVILDTHAMSSERRKLYGKAGAHRMTDYGVEYRTLSNFWLKHPTFVKLIHSLTEDALNMVDSGKLKETINFVSEEAIIRCINNGDQNSARFMINRTVRPMMSNQSKKLFDNASDIVDSIKGKKTQLEDHWSINVVRPQLAEI